MINTDPSFLPNTLRSIFSALDSVGYFFLNAVYNIFFTVASAKLFQGEVISQFYSRVQLILGIFMIFKLSLTLLQIIINPDSFKDKQKGTGALVTHIAIMIVMLTLIVPISFPIDNSNPLNRQINDNGILFGFLYQFQDTIVKENILGKIVLGSNHDTVSNEEGLGFSNMANVGDQMAFTVAKAFIRPTLKSGIDEDSVVDIENFEQNAACSEEVDSYFAPEGVTADALLMHLNDTCDSDGEETYAFNYTILGGLVCSIIMTIIILGFTVDVAVRAVKLAILRLIAPIPIISYIDPAQGKDGPFNNWIKTLTSTYLSLFIRLIVLYFGVYLITLLDDLVIWQNSTSVFTSFFASIFIIIGILMFMKEAPKFFQDMLGIKGDGKLFSGLGTMLGAAALTGGLAGSIATNARTAYGEQQAMGHGKVRSLAMGGLSAIAGGIGGAYAGGKALMTNDKKKASAVMAAMQKRNAVRAGGSTVLGRINDSAHSMFIGGSPVDKLDGQISAYNEFADLYKSVAAKADVDDMFDIVDAQGNHTNVKELKEMWERLKYAGASEADQKRAQDAYKAAQEQVINAMMNGSYTNSPYAKQMKKDYDAAMRIKKSAGLDLGDIDNAKQFKIASFDAVDNARNIKSSTQYKARKANQKK